VNLGVLTKEEALCIGEYASMSEKIISFIEEMQFAPSEGISLRYTSPKTHASSNVVVITGNLTVGC
jgi:hypothetical protein